MLGRGRSIDICMDGCDASGKQRIQYDRHTQQNSNASTSLRGLGLLAANLLRRRGLLFLLRHDDGRDAREGSLANRCGQHSCMRTDI